MSTRIFNLICLVFSALILAGVCHPAPGWSLDVELSPGPGEYPDPIRITIFVPDETRVYYTLDGSEPGTDSPEYDGGIRIEKDTVIRYVTVDPTGVKGMVAEALYRVGEQESPSRAPVTVADPVGGNFSQRIRVRLETTEGATIYYSIDESEPDTSSLVYLKPIPLNSDTVIKFFAVDITGEREPVRREKYAFDLLETLIDTSVPEGRVHPTPEEFRTGDLVHLESNEAGEIFYTLDGSEPTEGSMKYVDPFPLKEDTLVRFLVVDSQQNRSGIVSVSYSVDISPPLSRALPDSGLYVPPLKVKLEANEESAVVYYTLDGSQPHEGSPEFTDLIVLEEDTVLKYYSVDSMGNQEKVKTAEYTFDGSPPGTTAHPPGGEFRPPLTVQLETEREGRIHYTLDGADPDGESPLYSSPFTFSEPVTLKFFGVDGLGNKSPIQTHRYSFINGVWRRYARGVFLIPSVTDGKTFWMGSEEGLVIYSVGSGSRNFVGEGEGLLGTRINDLLLDEEGDLWVATELGINIYRDGKGFSHVDRNAGLPAREVFSLGIDIDNSIWAGTKSGVVHIRDGAVVEHFTRKDGLADNSVFAISVDALGTKWFGTRKGLSRFNGADWVSFDEEDGLVDDEVRTVAIDSNWNIWCGTSKGISMFDGGAWVNYTKADGLPGNGIVLIAPDPDGEIWVATRAGVVRFNGEEWIREESP